MQIAIELPNDFMALKEKQTVEQEMKLSYALRLYKASEVTLSKATELAGLDLYEFMSICKKEQVPVIEINKQELLEDLQGMMHQ